MELFIFGQIVCATIRIRPNTLNLYLVQYSISAPGLEISAWAILDIISRTGLKLMSPKFDTCDDLEASWCGMIWGSKGQRAVICLQSRQVRSVLFSCI